MSKHERSATHQDPTDSLGRKELHARVVGPEPALAERRETASSQPDTDPNDTDPDDTDPDDTDPDDTDPDDTDPTDSDPGAALNEAALLSAVEATLAGAVRTADGSWQFDRKRLRDACNDVVEDVRAKLKRLPLSGGGRLEQDGASRRRGEGRRPGGSNHGGRRPGAGRKKGTHRPRTLHRRRAAHDSAFPVHVTLRLRQEIVQTLRVPTLLALVKEVARDQLHPSRIYWMQFRIVEFSVQCHEIHLVTEARDAIGVVTKKGEPYTASMALRGGISGFMISFAHRFNKLSGRGQRGKVWDSRYERQDLRTPEQARDALRLLFRMGEHAGEQVDPTGVDPYSSGVVFQDFEDDPELPVDEEGDGWPLMQALTYLALGGWRKAGPIYSSDAAEAAGGASPRAAARTDRLMRGARAVLAHLSDANSRDALTPLERPRAKMPSVRRV